MVNKGEKIYFGRNKAVDYLRLNLLTKLISAQIVDTPIVVTTYLKNSGSLGKSLLVKKVVVSII